MSEIPKIYPAMLAAMQEIGAIGKNRKNPQQGYQFRGIDVVLNNLQPALSKAKLCIVPRIAELKREEKATKRGGVITYTTVSGEYDFVSAEDGSKVTAKTYGEGMDTSDKSTNKAMSAALKYAIIQTLAIPTEELLDSERDHIEPHKDSKPVDKPKPSPTPESPPKPADEATKAQKDKLLEMATNKFGSKEKGLAFIKWALQEAGQEYWSKSMISDFFSQFKDQAEIYKSLQPQN